MKYRLKDRNIMPRGGFPFREPSLNWPEKGWNPFREFNLIAHEIQMVRMQNPQAGLNPDIVVCRNDLDAFQCARLHNDERYCQQIPEPQADQPPGEPKRQAPKIPHKRTCCNKGRK